MKSLSVSLRRRGALILVVAIAAFAILWYNRRNKPEHLKPGNSFISESAPSELHYKLSDNPRNHTLTLAYRRSPAVGFQNIASTSLPPNLHYDPMFSRVLRINGDLVYFTLVKETKLQRPGDAVERTLALPLAKPITRNDMIIRREVIQPSKVERYVCCLSTQGGAIQTLLSGKGITNVAITDDTIYWIDPRPEPVTTVEKREGTGGVVVSETNTPTSLLMATSLKTLQTRRIADKMSLSIRFVSDRASIYWVDAHSGYWYYASGLSGPVHLTDNFTRGDGASYSNGGKPVALGDRLYWQEDREETIPPPKSDYANRVGTTSRVVETSVVSVRRDGTQRRVVLTLPVIANSPSFVIFAADRGRLYLGLTETVYRPSEIQEKTTICRVDPDAPQPLVKLLRLPDPVHISRIYRGYVYYDVSEEHNGLLGDERIKSLEHYRWRIPD